MPKTTDDLRIRRWGTIDDGYLGPAFHMRFKSGQVLYGSRRTYLRKVAMPDFEGICANTTFVLEAKDPTVLLPELLPFIMQTESFNDHSIKQSKGSVNPYVNFSDLAWYEFALPPLEEQRRIVERLFHVDAVLETLLTLANTTAILIDSLAEDFLSSFQSNVQCSLEELSDVAYGVTVNPIRRDATTQIPYLRVANVLRGQIDLNEVKNIGFIQGDEGYLLERSDVLIVEGHANSMEIGRAAIWNSEIEKCTHQNHLIRVRCNDKLDPEFLVIYLNSSFGRSYFVKHAKSTSGLNTINSRVVRDVPIPAIERGQQLRLVELVNEIRSQLATVNFRYTAIREIKSRLLMELC